MEDIIITKKHPEKQTADSVTGISCWMEQMDTGECSGPGGWTAFGAGERFEFMVSLHVCVVLGNHQNGHRTSPGFKNNININTASSNAV